MKFVVKTYSRGCFKQLKINELFESENVISFGKHRFLVNKQNIDLTIVPKENEQYYHITGTNFFEKIDHEEFDHTKAVWDQSVISESNEVYRGEYLAWLLFQRTIAEGPKAQHELINLSDHELIDFVGKFMSNRYQESYAKGIHDKDGAIILKRLMEMYLNGGVLKFSPFVRACGIFAWQFELTEDTRAQYQKRIHAVGVLKQAFPNTSESADLENDLANSIHPFIEAFHRSKCSRMCTPIEELNSDKFSIGKEAFELGDYFNKHQEINLLKHLTNQLIKLMILSQNLNSLLAG